MGGAVEAKAQPIQATKKRKINTISTIGIITAQSLIVFPRNNTS